MADSKGASDAVGMSEDTSATCNWQASSLYNMRGLLKSVWGFTMLGTLSSQAI